MLDVVGLGAGVGGVGLYLYNRFTGCTGDHVWGDWKPTNRWEVLPVSGRDSVCVDREYERSCQRDGCTASEFEYHGETNEVYAEAFEGMVEALPEVLHECPCCHEEIPISEIEIEWISMHRQGKVKHMKCPNCMKSSDSLVWDYVPYEEVAE